MAQYHIKSGRPVRALPAFPPLGTLRKILDRNFDKCLEHYSMGNIVLPNQNPLVQFLLQLSIDPTWDVDTLKLNLELNIRKVASQVKFTSIYNRGKDFSLTLFPESNHRTLIVTPYEETVYDFDKGETGSALRTIMTTSTKHYWNPKELTDAVSRTLPNDTYSVVELDPIKLAAGYWFYLKHRIQNGINVGLSPHHYCFLELIKFYREHNNVVLFNLVSEDVKVEVQSAGFAMESYTERLDSYCSWLLRYLKVNGVKNFSEYTTLFSPIYSGMSIPETIVPFHPKTMMFVQLAWVYTLSSLYWMNGLLKYQDFLGYEDGMEESSLEVFFRINENFNGNQILDPYWKKFYLELWKEVKNR